MPSISKIFPFLAQKVLNPSNFLPKPFPNRPKTFRKRPKIHPRAFWGPSWTNAFTRYDFESPKKRQNAPKSDHKAAQSVPNPSQIEPNTFQNQIFGRFFAFFFDRKFTSILYQFFRDFYMFFKEPTLKIHAPTQCFVDFSVKSQLWKKERKVIEKSSPNSSKTLPKFFQNREKSKKSLKNAMMI